MRIVCNFNIGEFSIWPGTILNIIIFIVASIFLYLIAKEIFENPYYALLVCFISGFSLAIIETVMYVRMYELLVLNILMLIYWHIRKNEKKELTYKDIVPLYLMVVVRIFNTLLLFNNCGNIIYNAYDKIFKTKRI